MRTPNGLQDLTPALSSPYTLTRSNLGATTKIINKKFICSIKEVLILSDALREKIKYFQPSKAGFQYLVSFTDNTHYENNDLALLEKNTSHSGKSTEKLILNWVIGHMHDGIENEMSITVRISNPINPFIILQAVMSKNPRDVDNIEFETGSVCISVNGATQNTSEEIFSIVGRWIDSCPKPYDFTTINMAIRKHSNKIEFMNYWILPILFCVIVFLYLKNIQSSMVSPYVFLALSSFILLRAASQILNNKIENWCHTSRTFSMFMLTGGDSNQQSQFAAKSKNSTIKLVASVSLSLILNVTAGIATTMLYEATK